VDHAGRPESRVTRRRTRALIRSAVVTLVSAVMLLAAGCASNRNKIPSGTSQPDKFLFENGTKALQNKRWNVARENFTKLIDSYPQSALRADAKLGVGDSYLGEATTESLVLAGNEYVEFLTFYPTNRRADYAQAQLALTHFRQMRSPERDQTETIAAIHEYEIFLQRYPNSSLLPDARAKYRQAKDRLSDSEFRVGQFYFKAGWYPGAIERLRALVKSDPEYTRRDAVYFYLAEALVKTEKTIDAIPYYERLIAEFGQSQYLAEAKRRVEQLKPKAG
jgi:outer membrane protein assembly factor BamD